MYVHTYACTHMYTYALVYTCTSCIHVHTYVYIYTLCIHVYTYKQPVYMLMHMYTKMYPIYMHPRMYHLHAPTYVPPTCTCITYMHPRMYHLHAPTSYVSPTCTHVSITCLSVCDISLSVCVVSILFSDSVFRVLSFAYPSTSVPLHTCMCAYTWIMCTQPEIKTYPSNETRKSAYRGTGRKKKKSADTTFIFSLENNYRADF